MILNLYIILIFILIYLYIIESIFIGNLSYFLKIKIKLYLLLNNFHSNYSKNLGYDYFNSISNIFIIDIILGLQIICLYFSYLPFCQGGLDFLMIFNLILVNILFLNIIYLCIV